MQSRVYRHAFSKGSGPRLMSYIQMKYKNKIKTKKNVVALVVDEHLGGISVFNILLPPNMGMEEEEGESVEESSYVQLWPLSLFSFFP